MKGIKKLEILACLQILLVVSTSFTSVYAQKQETLELNGFTKINFSISGDLYVKQAKDFSVKLIGSEKDLDKIIAKLDGTSLIIKTKNNSGSLNDIKVYVNLPTLTEISLAGSGNVLANEKISSEQIKLSISGSGDMHFKDLQTNNVKLSIAGSGDIIAVGINTGELKINIAGSGDIKAEDLKSKDIEVDISGSGSAKVWATDNLESDIVGSGSVRYKGNPLVDANSVGSGSTRSL